MQRNAPLIVVMPDTDLGVASIMAERLRRHIASQPFALDGARSIALTISVGLATLGAATDTPAQLLRRADQALYRAKRDGRNRVVAEAA